MAEGRSILLPLAGTVAGAVLVLASLAGAAGPSAQAVSPEAGADAQAGTLPYRVIGIQAAKDDTFGSDPSPTPTLAISPTATFTRTATVTGTPPTKQPTATKTPGTPIMISPTPTYTPTVPGSACGGATGSIIALDKAGEVVTITATGDLSDWWLQSWSGSQVFEFPTGFVANGTFTIVSGTPQFANTPGTLWWTELQVWDDVRDDDAILRNCIGEVVSRFDDGM